jgi:hypothetical protein
MSESEALKEFGEITFDIDAVSIGSSGEAFSARPERSTAERIAVPPANDETASPIFKLLATPEMPELKHETRARLMMQSPTRLYLYWAVAARSFQALQKTLGGEAGDYRLALRLLDLTTDVEELHAVDADGSWWFDVEPNHEYRAEIGFYSSTRPFVRILFSNTIATPRKSPSPRSASEARWAITTHTFAEVLEASGFEEDASEVIRSGQDENFGAVFASHVGVNESEFTGIDVDELRRALSLLAAGTPIEDLKWKFTAELYAILQAHLSSLTPAAIEQGLGISAASEEAEFETFSAVGGSLVNFPRRKYKPVSSINLR